jgi:hypothetical protein
MKADVFMDLKWLLDAIKTEDDRQYRDPLLMDSSALGTYRDMVIKYSGVDY